MAKEVATLSPGMVQVQTDLMALMDIVPESALDGAGIAQDLLNLSADSLIDATANAFDANSLPDIEQWYDAKITVTGIEKILSTYTDGEELTPWYFLVKFRDRNGDDYMATTSALQVMIVLGILYRDKALPASIVMRPSANSTRAGRNPVNVQVLEVGVGLVTS